jgi:hypothetical protein
MTGWRAYATVAFASIVIWHLLVAAGEWVTDRPRRGAGAYLERPFISALWGIPLSFAIGLLAAGLLD